MKYIKFIIIATILISCSGQAEKTNEEILEIQPYLDFLEHQNMSAKNYVLSLFKTNDIVILSERKHYEYTQYKTIIDIISDDYFINNVKNIFVEVGVSTEQEKVDEFLNSENLTESEISEKALAIYRNIPFLASWDKTVYYDFLINLYQINQNLEPDKKLRLYYSDIPFSWAKIKSQDEYRLFLDTINTRDSIIASQIINNYENIKFDNKKALVIMNYRHGFTNIYLKSEEKKVNNVGRFLKEKYKDKVASVLINDIYMDLKDDYYPIQNGKWDAAFEYMKKSDIGFNFKDSPFGNDKFDMYPVENDLTYKDVFTGFIYTSPIDSFIFKKGVKNYISSEFENEYTRRMILAGFQANVREDTIRMDWHYTEKMWCPNYDTVRFQIDEYKHATTRNKKHRAESAKFERHNIK